MKQVIITVALMAAFSVANAQTATSTKQYAKKEASVNEFNGATMNVANGFISFSGLPEMQKGTWAVITDANGEEIKQVRITQTENSVDVKKLKKGMYFVSLVYKSVSKKAFVLNI